MIKDSSLKKFLKHGKYKDLYDINSLEFKVALCGAFLVSVLFVIVLHGNTINNINNIFYGLTKDIAVALIGFLGFTVAGLAILTGVISQKEVQKVSKADNIQSLERILLSFYFLGLVISVTIIGLLILFVLSNSNFNYCLKAVIPTAFIFSYLVIFILFYAVKLIGNCLEIFFIVNESNFSNEKQKKDLKNVYNSYRLTALETVCLKKMEQRDLLEYMQIIKDCVEKNDNSKEELEKMYREHFNITS